MRWVTLFLRFYTFNLRLIVVSYNISVYNLTKDGFLYPSGCSGTHGDNSEMVGRRSQIPRIRFRGDRTNIDSGYIINREVFHGKQGQNRGNGTADNFE